VDLLFIVAGGESEVSQAVKSAYTGVLAFFEEGYL
jgi:hypothetical protein